MWGFCKSEVTFTRRGIVAIKDHPEHQKYIRYYEEMDIPAEFYWYTLRAAPSDDMHWMSAEEQRRYKIATP